MAASPIDAPYKTISFNTAVDWDPEPPAPVPLALRPRKHLCLTNTCTVRRGLLARVYGAFSGGNRPSHHSLAEAFTMPMASGSRCSRADR